MNSGTVNIGKIIAICNRLRIAPKSMRQGIIQELIVAANEGADSPREPRGETTPGTIATLRNALTWPEVRGNGLAVATICRSLRNLREAA